MSNEGKNEEAASIPQVEEKSDIEPALVEPDAMKIVQKDFAVAASVSVDRKQELLIAAREGRRRWIRQVPLPFQTTDVDPNDAWAQHAALKTVHKAAAQQLPTVTTVLSELYGIDSKKRTLEEISDRVETLLRPIEADGPKGNSSILEEEAVNKKVTEVLKTDDTMLHAYYDFWTTLLQPECALLVQGMRNFLGKLHGSDMEQLATELKSYIASTQESLKSHASWRERNCPWEMVLRSFGSFLYGQAEPLLDAIQWKGLFEVEEEAWMGRLQKLNFIEPKHLEIACLEDASLSPDEESILDGPIQSLLLVPKYFSPFEKLQCILAVYQGVNTVLSTALNRNNSQEQNRKLPSADDVLPTIILTVLKAKPKDLLKSLQIIEIFSPPEYLRGEAGYAYTNLFGAVQFLQDLDMENPDKLSISGEAFREGLAKSSAKVRERISTIPMLQQPEAYVPLQEVHFQARTIREARVRGECVDLDWALRNSHKKTVQQDMSLTVRLPDDFQRNYNFLGSRPEDIRLSDLPKLLSEYKTLVHVTEKLLGERSTRLAAEKRKKDTERQQQLDESFLGSKDEESKGRSRAPTF